MAELISLSTDQKKLFNAIDALRADVGHQIDLPQLVVCGDQSSGKSSVLEAICGVRFPRGAKLCTRFATEFVLRTATEDSASAVIIPGEDRSSCDRAELQTFNSNNFAMDDFPIIVGLATTAMGLPDGNAVPEDGTGISKDVLRVEISGPTQPHLTLVDLPGLFLVSDKYQTESDKATALELTEAYLQKPRSIILPVMSANTDISNQRITDCAAKFDPGKIRTLGILTKPDRAVGEGLKDKLVELAENKDTDRKFDLGWHVLRIRDNAHRDVSDAERDKMEARFFKQGVWADFDDPNSLGAKNLKARLSAILQDQILLQLPSLLSEGETVRRAFQKQLDKLNSKVLGGRDELETILRVSRDFSRLLGATSNGTYQDSFFSKSTADFEQKKLKKRVEVLLDGLDSRIEKAAQPPTALQAYWDQTSQEGKIVTNVDIDQVMKLLKVQMRSWSDAINALQEEIGKALEHTGLLILEHVADAQMVEQLQTRILATETKKTKQDLRNRLDEVLAEVDDSLKNGRLAGEQSFIDCLQTCLKNVRRATTESRLLKFFGMSSKSTTMTTTSVRSVDVAALLDELTLDSHADLWRVARDEVFSCTQAYYEVNRLLSHSKPLHQLMRLLTGSYSGHPDRRQACRAEGLAAKRRASHLQRESSQRPRQGCATRHCY